MRTKYTNKFGDKKNGELKKNDSGDNQKGRTRLYVRQKKFIAKFAADSDLNSVRDVTRQGD